MLTSLLVQLMTCKESKLTLNTKYHVLALFTDMDSILTRISKVQTRKTELFCQQRLKTHPLIGIKREF